MTRSLRAGAMSLGAANAIDYGLQFLLPVVLARTLDTVDFGVYRLFWLVTSTALALSVLGFPQSLYYFLPRAAGSEKRLYINQAILFLAVTGFLAAVAILPGSPLLPHNANLLSAYGLLPSAFVLLWIVSNILDTLPTADGNVLWQAKAIIGLSVIRTLALSGTAILTGSITAVLWALLAFVLFKLTLLTAYMVSHYGIGKPYASKCTFREQAGYAIPFGLAGMLYNLRGQVDQWIVATLFTVSQYAAFSVASVLAPLVGLFRQSMNQAFMHRMSMHQADGDTAAMLDINNRANVALALILFPLLALAFAFPHALISLIYTTAYVQGGDVMRVYVVGMFALSVELNNVILLLNEGKFATRVNIVALCVCIAGSLVFVQIYGLAGAAVGSVIAVFVERILTLNRIGKRLSLPLRELQDWSTLGKILLAAAIGAMVTWVALPAIIPATFPMLVQLGSAGIVLAVVYLMALLLLGMRPTVRALIMRKP